MVKFKLRKFFKPKSKKEIISNLHLFFTGITRDASKILNYQDKNATKIKKQLIQIRDLVDPFEKCLHKNNSFENIGVYLKKNWDIKKKYQIKFQQILLIKNLKMHYLMEQLAGRSWRRWRRILFILCK